jgi:hypothetical protein
MTSKLLAFYVFAGMIEASHVRARGRSCDAAKEKSSSVPDAAGIPCVRGPLECRWQIDPTTGALTSYWVDPSATGCDCDDEAGTAPTASH